MGGRSALGYPRRGLNANRLLAARTWIKYVLHRGALLGAKLPNCLQCDCARLPNLVQMDNSNSPHVVCCFLQLKGLTP